MLTGMPHEISSRQDTWRTPIPDQEIQALPEYDGVQSGGTILVKEDIKKMRSGAYLPDRVIDAFISRLVGNPHVVVHKTAFYEEWAGATRPETPNFEALSNNLTER